jgi:hypothetical protein
VTTDTYTSHNCLSNLCCKVSVRLVIIIDIEIVSINVVSISISTTTTSTSAIRLCSWIVNDLFTDNALYIALVAVWALANARVVEEDQGTLALKTPCRVGGRALLTTWIAPNATIILSCIAHWTLIEALGTEKETEEARQTGVDCGHAGSTRILTLCAVEVNTGVTTVTSADALSFREQWDIAVLHT